MATTLTLYDDKGKEVTLYTNTQGNSPGYNIQLIYTEAKRSGTTVTLTEAILKLTRNVGTYGTLNRVACKVGTGTNSTNVKNNATIRASQKGTENYSGSSMQIELENLVLENHTSDKFQVNVLVASTGWSSGWDNFQGGSPVGGAFYVDVPLAYPTFTTQPSATNEEETSVTLNPGVTNMKSKFYYKLSSSSTWIEFSSSIQITGLSPGTAYTINVQARNEADTSLATNATNISVTTKKYPYILSITTGTSTSSRSNAGEQQTVKIYNPLKRDIILYMDHNSKGGTNIYTSVSFNGEEHSFTIPLDKAGKALGATGKTGNAIYHVKYGSQASATITGYYQITEAYAKPTWSASLNISNLIKYKDGNTTSAGVTGSTDSAPILLQKYSTLYVGLNSSSYGATAQYSAAISKYQISINSGSYVDYTGSASATTGVQNMSHTVAANAVSVSVKVRAIDGRGFISEAKELVIPVRAYSSPTGAARFERNGGYGTAATVTVSPTWGYPKPSGAEKATVITRQKGTTTTIETLSFTSLKTSASKAATKTYNNNLVYECVATFTDAFGTASSAVIGTMIEGQPIFFIDSEIGGVGVNCFPAKQGLTLPSNKPLIMNDLQFKTLKCSTASLGSTQYFKIGTWTTTQNGKKLRIQGSGAMGYNATTGQLYSFEVVVNTSNGGSHATYGYFKAMANITNDTGRELVTFKTYLVQNSSTSCDIWMEQSSYDSRYLTIMFDSADSFTLSGTMSATAPTTNYVTAARTLIDQIYPIGSMYVSTKETSPASLFGGSWTKIKDKFLYATSTTGDAGKDGGNSTTSYTPAGTVTGSVGGHALTVAQIPQHGHPQNYSGGGDGDTNRAITRSTGGSTAEDNVHGKYQGCYMPNHAGWSSTYYTIIGTGRVGGGESHTHSFSGSFKGTAASLSINPAHYTVHAWVRTA